MEARKLEYHYLLRDVSTAMVRLKKPERLVKIIMRLIDREFSLTHTSILLFEERKAHYVFTDSKGSRRLPLGLIKMDVHHPLIRWFTAPKKPARFLARGHIYVPDLKRLTLGKKAEMEGQQEIASVLKMLGILKAELVIPCYFKNQLLGLLLLGPKANGRIFTRSEFVFLHVLAQDCSMAIKSAEFHRHLIERNELLLQQVNEVERLRKKEHDTFFEIMRSLAQEVHAKDAYTFGHVHQVERLGIMTAKEMGYDLRGDKKDILSAGLILHDVGKIGIPDHILKKPAKLDPEEWVIMKTHPERGFGILKHLSAFKEVANIVLTHHENYDGTGYPRGLEGDEIPIEARIISVVDAFHAIVSTRCYSKGRPVEAAFDELERCAGKQFDPGVVNAFIRAIKKDMQRRGVGVMEELVGSKKELGS